ncbi:hypothetical protein BKA04_001556 [Cryobacterium mesophilum]|nr:hypothetical protein [Terrimesophilobacter mesophilus]MBB5633333.1 hypothetical protein [Terrimesophilobacter mesophilus]
MITTTLVTIHPSVTAVADVLAIRIPPAALALSAGERSHRTEGIV